MTRVLPCEATKRRFELVRPLLELDAQPERLETPDPPLAVDVDPLDGEIIARQPQHLAPPRAPIAEAEGDIEGRDIEPEKAADRPGAERDEDDANDEAQEPQEQHHQVKAARRQAAVRQQDALEENGGAGTHRHKIGCPRGWRKAGERGRGAFGSRP